MKPAWLRRVAPVAVLSITHSIVLASAPLAFADVKAPPASAAPAAPAVKATAGSPSSPAGATSAGSAHEELTARAQRLFDDQQYEESIQILSAALVRPLNTKQQKVDIYRLLALNYITLNRKDEAEAAVRGLLTIAPNYELPPSESPRFRDYFKTTRDRWVADGLPGLVHDAEVQQVKAELRHTAPIEAKEETQLDLVINLIDPAARVQSMKVFYRAGSSGAFTDTIGNISGDTARASIPPSAVKSPIMQYYILAYDKTGIAVASCGDLGSPLVVPVKEKSHLWVPLVLGGTVVAAAVAVGVLALAGVFKSSK